MDQEAAGSNSTNNNNQSSQSSTTTMKTANPIDNAMRDFWQMLDKCGLSTEQASSLLVLEELQVRSDLRPLEMRTATDNLIRFSSPAYIYLWASSDPIFHGTGSQFDLFLSNTHPSSLSLPVGHVSLDQLPRLAIAANTWKIVGDRPIMDAIDFYLSRAVEVPACEKLHTAAVTGSSLLLESTLHNDCGKVEAINAITESLVFDGIWAAVYGSSVMKRMLQHSARCQDNVYSDGELSPRYEQLLSDCRDRLRSIDCLHRTPDFDLKWIDVIIGDDDQRVLRCSRWAFASYSPVLKEMLYGTFLEADQSRVSLFTDEPDMSHRAMQSFVALLQPTGLNALWWLCPKEIAELDWRNSHPIVDQLFDIIFDANFDVLMCIFRTAHKFQVTKLVRFCEMMIDNKGNVALSEMLRLADLYHLPDLMARCLSRITSNVILEEQVYKTPGLLSSLNKNTLLLLHERNRQLNN